MFAWTEAVIVSLSLIGQQIDLGQI